MNFFFEGTRIYDIILLANVYIPLAEEQNGIKNLNMLAL